MAMESLSALTRDRLLKWQSNRMMVTQNSDSEQQSCQRKKVKRIFDMKTLVEIGTHEALWEVMEKMPGWIRKEKDGQMEYFLINRNIWAQASLPTDLSSASSDVLHNFVNTVNTFEHADIFAVWEIFKAVPIPHKNSLASQCHHDKSENPSTSKHGHDFGYSSESEVDDVMPKQLYTS